MQAVSCALWLSFAVAGTPLGAQQTFGPMQTWLGGPATASITTLASGDLNRDGFPDLITGQQTGMSVLLGDGAGGFAPPIDYGVVPLASEVVPTDLDRDGLLDLVVASMHGAILWLGDGSGAVAFSHNLGLPGKSGDLLADLDGDGRPDLVAPLGYDILVAYGTTPWGFLPPVLVPVPATTGLGVICLARDIDGDGWVDLAVSDPVATAMYVLFADGVGGFLLPTGVPLGTSCNEVDLGDVDADGRLDFVATTHGNPNAVVVRNLSGRSFAPPLAIPLAAAAWSSRIALVDADGDGDGDLVVACDTDTFVLAGDGTGSFGAPVALPGSRRLVHLVDLDLDGRLDLVTLGAANNLLGVRRGTVPLLTGTLAFGGGSPTCHGAIGIATNQTPSIGSPDCRVLVTNAPVDQTGFVAFGAADLAGSDPFGFGLRLHLQWPSLLATANLQSDRHGMATFPLPIPPLAALVGYQLAVQTFWQGETGRGNTCGSAAFELASSRGLSLTVQQ